MRCDRPSAFRTACSGLAAATCLLGTLPAGPVAAQVGASPSPTVIQASSHEAEASLALYLDCVVRDGDRRKRALEYLRLDAAAPKAIELYDKLKSPDCLGLAIPDSVTPTAAERSSKAGYLGPESFDVYSLSVQPVALRNALYPALYREAFGEAGPGAIADKPLLSASAEWDEVPDPLPDVWRVRRAIGDCMARAHPATVHRFVVSRPWSEAESAEMQEIAGALAECLPEGQTVRLGREDLRGIVGEALYKLAVAPEAPAVVTPAEAN